MAGSADKLIYDSDGVIIYDGMDLQPFYDANDLPEADVAPPLEGQIDPVGGPLGGPIAERLYLLRASITLGPTEAVTYDGATLFLTIGGDSEVVTFSTGAGAGSGDELTARWPSTASFPTSGFPFDVEVLSTGYSLSFRLASDDWVTKPNDPVSPSVFWDGRVSDPGSLNLAMSLTPVGEAAIKVGFGSVTIDNTDGAYDTLFDLTGAISQSVDILAGTKNHHLSEFLTICVARISGIAMTEQELTLELSDPAAYSQNSFPTTIYTGLGGLGGTPDLEGAVKPVILGRVQNMSPVLFDPVKLIYQMHDGPIAAVSGVFDGGVPLTFHANYAGYGLLAAATIPSGKYGTSLVDGILRVGSTPAYSITANVDGLLAAGVTIRSLAGYLMSQLQTVLGLEIDSVAFDLLPTYAAGWVWTESFTFNDAVSRFVGDAGYNWGADAEGNVTLYRLLPPDPSDVSQSFDIADITSIERVSPPDGYQGLHQSRVVNFSRNWTVQKDALAATAVQQPFRQKEWRRALKTRSTFSRNALDPEPLDTSLQIRADAELTANYLLDLHSVPRRMFNFEAHIFGGIPRLADTIKVTYPRFGLGEGVLFRIVAIDFRLQNSSVRLLVWG